MIENIEVKKSDRNSLIAKQRALSAALRIAFSRLLSERLKVSGGASVASSFSERQINDCVYDYSIDQEKYSESFYIGEFSYRFCKLRVAELFRERGIKCDSFDIPKKVSVIKLVTYISDFVTNINRLKKFGCSVERFSGEKIIFTIRKNSISDFEKLGIRYAMP
ncbi:MAG: hypothetical protein LBB29_01345 [Holosporaceae bacterium]|nr:hypothetical protein [Holosporaceae bacterium]